MADENGVVEQTEEVQGHDPHGLYDLSKTPEELRPYVTEQLQEISKNVDARFREAAEYRKKFEPLEQIEGLTDVDPEELQALLQFREIASDPESLREWLGQVAQEIGWEPEMDEDSWAKVGQENGWLDEEDFEDAGDGQEMTMDDIVAAVKEALQPEIEPVKEHMQRQQEQQTVQQMEQEMRQQLDALKEQHGDFDEDDVIGLAMRYVEDDNPIEKAFGDYQRIRGKSQSDLVDEKLADGTGQTLNNGAASTDPPRFSLGDKGLKEAARARLSQAG